MPSLRFELRELIATDAEGVTYRALDRQSGDAVEVRFPGTEPDLHWPHVERRARLSMLVTSPGVRVVRACESDPRDRFLALDPPPPQTLKELLEGRLPLAPAVAVPVLLSINDVLIAAHQVGLSHGRLTPDQIGWSGPIDAVESTCILDFTRCPPSPRLDSTDDVRQLAELWTWMTGGSPTNVTSNEPELSVLLGSMKAPEPADRPTAAAIGQALETWIRVHRADRPRFGVDNPSENRAPQLVSADPPGSQSADERLSSVEETIVGLAEGAPSGEIDVVYRPADGIPASSSGAAAVQTVSASDPLEGREKLGRFRLLTKLGEGGMGAVWKAEDPVDGSLVAIKVLRTDRAQNETVLKRFHREARLLAEVNNPHIANLLEINADGDLHYIVLEFVDGMNLLSCLKERGRLAEREAMLIAADVARALRDAHERGIVHRDLKPENILLRRAHGAPSDGDGEACPAVKLTDFGLARHVDESESMQLTRAGSMLGTPLYMAPEQCSGKGEVDARADVYSLGATLFHALAGQPPFSGKTMMAVIAQHVNDPAPRVRTLVPELSEALENVAAKCLQKNPDTRYQGAGEMLADLERLLRGEPTSIIAHPRLPPGDRKDVLEFDFSWELKSRPEALWPHVSNTERLNRAIGLSAIDYTATPNPQGGSRRFAQFRKLGMAIAWEEHPFEWIEARRMGVLREFKQGPWKWFTSIVELNPRADGGTSLTHRIRILPLNFVGRTAARIEVGIKSRAALERVYRHIDAAVSGELGTAADPFEDPNELPATARQVLEERLEKLVERGVAPLLAQRLGEYLTDAPPQEVSRIRPLALARRLAADEKQVLEACLIGAREGLLTMQWDIICPLCRIPAQVRTSLRTIQDHGNCEACQSDFSVDFANSIELIFRLAADIRAVETGVFCVGGPAHSPHVAAQIRLAPGERCELELALTEGAYRLRGPQLPYAIDFRVFPHALATRWELELVLGRNAELPRQLKPGRQVFVLTNDAEHEITARIERIANRVDACTAARAAATPLFRELFPSECLAPDQLVQIEQVTLLFTRLERAERLYFELGDSRAFARLHEHFRALDSIIRAEGGSLFKTVAEGACAVFTDPALALRAALALRSLPEPGLRVALHRGPAMVATINEHLDYFGSTVSVTQQWLSADSTTQGMNGPRVFVTDVIARDPGVASALSAAASPLRLTPVTIAQELPGDSLFGYELVSSPETLSAHDVSRWGGTL